MEWLKVSITTTTAGTEPIADLLLSCGISGVEIIDPREYGAFLAQDKQAWDYVDASLVAFPQADEARVVFYLTADENGAFALEDIRARLLALSLPPIDLGARTLVTERVNDADWLHEWKKHFAPMNTKARA